MNSICIITDCFVQFPQPSFIGRQSVKILNQGYQLNGHLYENGKDLKASELPPFPGESQKPQIIQPTGDQIRQFFSSIEDEHSYDRILAILTSSQLSPLFLNVKEALKTFPARVQVLLID